jgi:hypothetical protein
MKIVSVFFVFFALILCAAQATASILPLGRSMLFKRAIAISLLALGLAPSAQATPVAHRWFYAVNTANTTTATPRGSVSVYDMDNGHGLVKTILTGLPITSDPRGVVVSTITNSMYISYRDADHSGNFHVYCLNLLTDSACAGYTEASIVGSDRLALDPNGTVLYVPTWEENKTSKFIYEIDARTGAIISEISTGVTQEHDAQYPLSGPLFQESRAPSGGNNLLKIYPGTSVSSIPFTSTIGPFVVNGKSTYVVANINGVNGFEIADLAVGNLIGEATQPGPTYWPHGIAFNPSETQVWSSMKNTAGQEVVAVWGMIYPIWGMNPIPVFEGTINSATSLVHWINFSIMGDYAYIAAGEYETANTLVINTSTYAPVASITHSENMLEVDVMATGTAVNSITAVGDQYGIGRVR